MASEREEVFFARVVELGLEDCVPAMKTKGIKTFAGMGFGTDYNPQMPDPTLLNQQLLVPLSGGNEELVPALRRLWWESWSVATNDMRKHIDAADGDAPRKLGPVEFQARRDQVTSRLTGLRFEGELDVGDGLITLFTGMYDRDRLQYAPWEQCVKRELETAGIKQDENWKRDPATGFMKQVSEASSSKCADLSTDLLLDYALKRRGLAMAMGDLLRAPPPGYAKTSLTQVRRADEAAFALMSRLAKGGIRRKNGVRPLDTIISDVLKHEDFTIHLQPLPHGAHQALRYPGNSATDDAGVPVCFGYNLNTCDKAPPGGRCPKGRHARSEREVGGPQVLEMCCGSARLTAAFSSEGVPGLGVDWKGNRHESRGPWVQLDLTTNEGQSAFLQLLGSAQTLTLAWISLPCGTATRARDIQDIPGLPQPLRSAREPWGRTDVEFSADDMQKLSRANSLYRFAIVVVDRCEHMGVQWIIENPANSLLWYMQEFVSLLSRAGVADTEFHACMVGGLRPKSVRLRGTATCVRTLHNRWCDSGHSHAPWRRQGAATTAEESEYPDKFCREMVTSLVKERQSATSDVVAALREGAQTSCSTPLAASALAAAKRPKRQAGPPGCAGVGKQPRGTKYPRLIPVYRDVRVVKCSQVDLATLEDACGGEVKAKATLIKDAVVATVPLDKGMRILQILENGGECGNNAEVTVQLGAPAPEQALGAGEWPGKRSLLLEGMAAAAGFPNPRMLGAYIRQGTPVFGEVPASGAFEKDEQPAGKSLREVLEASKWTKQRLRDTVKPGTFEVGEEVVKRTEEEVAQGKALGPFSEEEVDQCLGKVWAGSRRFGLVQSSGVRPVDDHSEFGQNWTSHTHEYIDLGGVDQVAAVARLWGTAASSTGRVQVQLSTGEMLRGRLHQGFAPKAARSLRGRALDLKRAFKQLAPLPSLSPLLVIALRHPARNGVAYYVLRAMPFGARNAVYVFGTVARAIEMILSELFLLALTQYVGDIPQLEPEACIDSATVAEEVMQLLGWEVKRDAAGCLPRFASSFSALGVVFDLSRVVDSELMISNKPERATRASELARALAEGGWVKQPVLTQLLGVLAYSRAQCFGRCGAAALQPLSAAAHGPPKRVDGTLLVQLEAAVALLRESKPRTLLLRDHRLPVLLWVDGSEEQGVVEGGAVLDDRGAVSEYIQFVVSPQLVEAWRRENGLTKVIHQAELLPIAVALATWRAAVRGRRVIVFVDNDAARAAMVNGHSGTPASARLVGTAWALAQEQCAYLWFDRVPSPSNVADGPSRGKVENAERLGFVQARAVFPSPESLCLVKV
ncbi:unnamed protein product [Prorocentrum cordatum]|uniref:Uncharacterized protein n=1 Tax=Prorocentrum cordatum TaxID=2364126 RepID=A0ABN9YB82_9DINO|nr:unnamed protein product [Polarella glacialis]